MSLRRAHSEGVAFHTPVSQWVFGVIKVFFLSVTLALVIATAWFALLILPWPQRVPPAWLVIVSAIAFPLVVIVVTARLGRHELRRTIILFSDELWIGGFVFGSTVFYDAVRLVRLVHPKKTMNKLSQVAIEMRGHGRASIWLRERDALECFEALRGFCDRAAAVGRHEEVYHPSDPKYSTEATMVLAASLRRRAWRAIAFCALILLWWGAMLVGVFLGGAKSSSAHGPWHLMAMLPVIACGMAASAIRDRRAAREHLATVRQTETG